MDRTYAEAETVEIAQDILAGLPVFADKATILALQGDLGAGKTTLAKALAGLLHVQEAVASPTFVIAKFYPVPSHGFETMVHMDAYRIDSLEELGPLGWQQLVQRPKTLLVLEWPEKITDALPTERNHFTITHEGDSRRIKQIQ
jgi:tRNA threonylcarbamoyladenosine biosynthesis protein TsaE